MAFTPSEDLERMIFVRLQAYAPLTALIGDGLHHRAPPQAAVPYVSFGPSDWNEDDADCIVSGEYSLQVDVWSREAGGQIECKRIADTVKKALHRYDGQLADNALVFMRVTNMRILDDPDGVTTHGVVTVQAVVEES